MFSEKPLWEGFTQTPRRENPAVSSFIFQVDEKGFS